MGRDDKASRLRFQFALFQVWLRLPEVQEAMADFMDQDGRAISEGERVGKRDALTLVTRIPFGATVNTASLNRDAFFRSVSQKAAAKKT